MSVTRIKRLLFEHQDISDERTPDCGPPVSEERIDALKEDGIEAIFIISSEEVSADQYLLLVEGFRKAGFKVRGLYCDRNSLSRFSSIYQIVSEIDTEYRRAGCLILSYGESTAPFIAACYYLYTGMSASRALYKIGRVDPGFMDRYDEIALVYKFKGFLSERG